MLGRVLRPDPHQQHLLPLGAIADSTYAGLPTNINRYFLRTVDMDVVNDGSTAFVYTKVGPFIFLGFIAMPFASQWQGTRIYASNGSIRPRNYTLPKNFAEYLFARARKTAQLKENISDAQRQKIRVGYQSNMDRAMHSDCMRALDHDVRMFGRRAFGKD
jgi:hypothetical protein